MFVAVPLTLLTIDCSDSLDDVHCDDSEPAATFRPVARDCAVPMRAVRAAESPGLFATSSQPFQYDESRACSPLAPGSPNEFSMSDNVPCMLFRFDSVPFSVLARCSRKVSCSRWTSERLTPAPMPSDFEYIAGMTEPPTAVKTARWRVYPAVLELAMFCPVTSSALRSACSADSALPIVPNSVPFRSPRRAAGAGGLSPLACQPRCSRRRRLRRSRAMSLVRSGRRC